MPSISTDAAIQSVLAAEQSATRSDIATSVAAKTLRAQEAAGEAALALLDAASSPSQGKAVGKGQQLDKTG